ncbi:MAG: DUF2889 domain-containing protein [Rhodospirillaceae bacterium]|jgi:hypothetical protein|nr:DUF2889 domain-containing protein [Rhodospirillaceae bacterium]MBT5374789.1 DUF2889 domain-containing protein [Rhodospirillaceae bacterium]MBT5658844.1 DUF2889 domain-containing protein [Rhodospirillaceae bacterium]MBT5753023.1 DUF2889 domain-containing protein [Rhodospirillaceae bacterium]
MPLSAPSLRQPLHRRNIECCGFKREDGLYDIEARLTDTKAYDFPNEFRGEIKNGEPVHDMWIRLTVNADIEIITVEAVMDAFPYRICPDIEPTFKALEGLTIGPGWSRKVKQRIGGMKGCTHMVELLGPLATAAFQTIVPLRQRLEKTATSSQGTESGDEPPPPQIDSCHAYARDSEVVKKHWPQFYKDGK